MIHPTAIIDWDTVKIAKSAKIGAYCVISHADIDEETVISPHVVIGQEAEHSFSKYELTSNPVGRIVIGKRVVIREFSSITLPTAGLNLIEDDVYIMGRCHIAHDCVVERNAVLSIASVLAGWTRVMEGANVGLGATCHQFSTIGQYAMIAMNAAVVKDVPPLAKYIPGKPLGINVYAIRKRVLPLVGDAPEEIQKESFYADLLKGWEAKRHKERPVYGFAESLC